MDVRLTLNGGRQVGKIRMKQKDIGVLSEEELVKLCAKEKNFNQNVGNSFVSYQWGKTEFLQSVLNFTVPFSNRKDPKERELTQEKN